MRRKMFFLLFLLILVSFTISINIYAGETYSSEDYKSRYDSIKSLNNLRDMVIIGEQVFDIEFENFGQVQFVPLLDEKYGKIIICLVDESGQVIYKTDLIESNYWYRKSLIQPNDGVLAVSFQDMNEDGRKDISIICLCSNKDGDLTGSSFKIGDILFQNKNGFLSDEATTGMINRYSMNDNIDTMRSFVTGENSKSFLYTSDTLKDLTDKGFKVNTKHVFNVEFEEFGKLKVVPGFYAMGGIRTLLIYLVDSKDKICSILEPMKDYHDLVTFRSISFNDINGDGLKDITIMADFRYCGKDGFSETQTDYTVFLQGLYSFDRDYDYENTYKIEKPKNIVNIVSIVKKHFKLIAEKRAQNG